MKRVIELFSRTLIGVGLVVGALASNGVGAREVEQQNFPPDPQVEWKHLRLDLRVEDLDKAELIGKATYRIGATADPVSELRLDAGNMEILAVVDRRPGGQPLKWTHENEVLRIALASPLGPKGNQQTLQDLTVEIDYRVTNPKQGMTFSPATPGCDGRPAQAAQLHTQGQPESNHDWFPVHDFPNIKLTTEAVIDVPLGVSASSNGRLVAHFRQGNREIWHWLQDKPHVPYLVSVVAGDFERTQLPSPLSGVDMAVWSDPSRAHLAKGTYGNTDRMVECFTRAFGRRYPWDRYDQLVVRNFGSGGMENTSATTMHPGALLDEISLLEGDLDGLISHELCHQWTGDLMTCRSWEHLWLNEGWATYGTALWMEARDGMDGYYDQMLASAAVADGDSGVTGADPPVASLPMCSRVYSSPGETFRRAANPYPKGASILHMLRRSLGDKAFFDGVHLYTERFAGKLVETDDFRHCLEEVSGRSLEKFFNQWCFEPGCPRVKVTGKYDPQSKAVSIQVNQQPRASGLRPFEFTLPVLVKTAQGEHCLRVTTNDLECTMTVQLDSPPTMIAVDPMLDVLKVLEVDIPTELLIEQMKSAPTVASRRQAVRALRGKDSPDVIGALSAVVADPSARTSLRTEAAEALNAMGSVPSRETARRLFDQLVVPTLADSPQDAAKKCHPRLRSVLIEGIALASSDEATALLTGVLEQDEQYSCKVEALKGLARLGGVDFPQRRAQLQQDSVLRDAIGGALKMSTPGEKVRSAALEACGSLGLVELRESVVELANPCYPDRLRPVAIETIAKLQAIESQAALRGSTIAWLVGLLDDPESRTRDGAGEALASLGAVECLPRLEAIAKDDASERTRQRAAEWVKRIKK